MNINEREIKMAFIIPEANTHPDVAKDQHLVPRTYMREWSPKSNDSIWVFNKEEMEEGIQPQNVNKINYKTGFHDIKAGDIFVPEEALQELFGFLKKYRIELDGKELKELSELNDHYFEYDKWEIYDEENNLATRKIKNEIKRIINQSRYTFIETEWCYQFEDNWTNYIHRFEEKVRCKALAKPYVPDENERKELMQYILIYDFRNIKGNAWINSIIDEVFPPEMAEVEIPYKERIHKFNNTIGDEFKHESRKKAFYEFLKNRQGKMDLMLQNYLKSFGIRICLTSIDFPFMTCETPSMMIKRIDGLYEHIFVATPTMLITTYKTDQFLFSRSYFKPKDVRRYNQYIVKNGNLIITLKNDAKTEQFCINNR